MKGPATEPNLPPALPRLVKLRYWGDTTSPAASKHAHVRVGAAANALVIATNKPPKRFLLRIVLGTHRLELNRRVRDLLGSVCRSHRSTRRTLLAGWKCERSHHSGFPEHAPIYVEASVLEQPWVIVEAGDRGAKLELPPAAIVSLPNARVVQRLNR